ncbi:MAG: carboxymuconolactone decarboxylase family protein [Candidatus Sumerlaeota bacterium]|nr:carboxymuconolactone decarboxylase family protein [Candidatus Sumerlaeota bacterium]
MNGLMDERMKELIAVGASIAAHCQPCLTYHVGRATDLGLSADQIRAAMEIGHMVEMGSMAAMREFAKGALDTPGQMASACCPGNASLGMKGCCG